MTLDLQQIVQQSRKIIEEVAQFIGAEVGNVRNEAIEVKSFNSLVSYVDKTAEEMLVKGLGAILPEATFITEEDTVANQESALVWIIDPLDGTTNFLHQLPFFSLSVALQENQETVMGVVYEVNRNECFYAWKGGGAFLNEKPITVSPNPGIANSILATGFPYEDYSAIGGYFEVLEHLMRNARGIRRFGSAALDLAFVAAGRFDAFFEYGLNAWDVAAGAFIVEMAGGKVTDFHGGNDYLFGRSLLASNGNIHQEMLELTQKAFSNKMK